MNELFANKLQSLAAISGQMLLPSKEDVPYYYRQ